MTAASRQVNCAVQALNKLKTTNSKGSAEQEDESSPFFCTTTPDRTPVCAQERQLEQWGGLFFLNLPTIPI